MVLAVLFAAACGSAVISGLVGMAGGVTLLAILTFYYPMHVIIPLHGATQFVSNVSRSYILRRGIKWSVFRNFAWGAPLGGVVAYFVLREIKHHESILVLIAGLLFYVALKPKKLPDIKLPDRGFVLLGVVAGFLGSLMGATGPLLAPFFAREDIGKEEIVATKASCQIVVHLIKFPVFIGLAFPYDTYVSEILVMVIGVIIGTKIGTMLLDRVPRATFQKILKTILFLTGVRVLYKILA